MTKKQTVYISAKRNWLDLNLREVWQYRDLIVLFTKRAFVIRYKQTILGPLWIILNPFLTSFMFTLVFGYVAGLSTDGIPQILFYMTGNALWGYFADCVTRNANTFTANAAVFGKVYFPRLTISVSNVLSSIIQFGIQMIMTAGLLIYFIIKREVFPNWLAWPWIPFIVIHLGLLGIGIGMVISSLTTKYKDLSILVGFGVSLWMYATPVVYPLSQLSDGILKTIVLINPVTAPIEAFRYAFLGNGAIDYSFVILSLLMTALLDFLGIMLFKHVERTFLDTV